MNIGDDGIDLFKGTSINAHLSALTCLNLPSMISGFRTMTMSQLGFFDIANRYAGLDAKRVKSPMPNDI